MARCCSRSYWSWWTAKCTDECTSCLDHTCLFTSSIVMGVGVHSQLKHDTAHISILIILLRRDISTTSKLATQQFKYLKFLVPRHNAWHQIRLILSNYSKQCLCRSTIHISIWVMWDVELSSVQKLSYLAVWYFCKMYWVGSGGYVAEPDYCYS